MKSSIDQQFETHPLDFLQTHTVQPQDFKNFDRTVQLYDQKTHTQPGGAALDSVLTVQRRVNQVAFTKLEQITDNTTNAISDHNSFKLFFEQRARITGAVTDYIACWFLPWASNHVTKMTIPPKVPPKPGSGPVAAATDPDIFFTAAINGCSVMVTGDPRTPTIAHGGTTDNRSNLSHEDAFAGGNAKLHWTTLFRQNQQGSGNNGPIYGIHKGDYVNTAQSGTTRAATMYSDYFKNTPSNNMRVETVLPKGAVFGLRDGTGNWSFYLQKSVSITFTKLVKKKSLLKGTNYVPATKEVSKGQLLPPEIVVDQRTVTVPIQLVKFFPGGGNAAPDAFLPPATVKFVLDAYV